MSVPFASDPSGPASFLEFIGFVSCMFLGAATLVLAVLGLRCALEHDDKAADTLEEK